MFEEKIKGALSREIPIKKEDIILEIPRQEFGDFAFPCFNLGKIQNENPSNIARDLTIKLKDKIKGIEVKQIGPYVNFIINREILVEHVIKKIIKEGKGYGYTNEGKGKKIVIDFSSPNIAKPFSIGHLRSSIIGYSLYKIFNNLGYKSIGINYLGDWGTQFGQLIYEFKKHGSESRLKKEGIHYLLELYIKFNKDVEKNPELQEKAREEFKKLEEGDEESLKIWKKFREMSLKEFNELYKKIGIKFDFYVGESSYNKKLDSIIEMLKKKGLVKESQGALVVQTDKNAPPCILRKSDGASTYELRDIAAAIDRYFKFKPEKILYVVGSEQKFHFEQFFKVLRMAGFSFVKNCVHVPFGLITLPEGKISTRQGRVIFMEDVINKAVSLAEKIIEGKNPNIANYKKKKIAEKIAIGTIIYNDLSNDRILNIKFDWNKALSLEGNSAPYLQYSYVRANSILKKAGVIKKKPVYKNIDDREKLLAHELLMMPKVVKQAAENYKPNLIANYCYNLSQIFNDFYENCPVINAESGIKERRVMLVKAAKQVLENCFNLLLVPVIEEM